MANMALAGTMSAFPPFDLTDRASIAPRWKKYVKRFEIRANSLQLENPTAKLNLLLDYAGESVSDEFEVLTVTAAVDDQPNQDEYSRSLKALNDHFAPQVEIEYERFNFVEATQESDEALDAFAARLQRLAITCDFADKDAEIKSQIIRRGKSSKLRTWSLSQPRTLKDILSHGTAMERSIRQAKTIEKETVNRISWTKSQGQNQGRNQGQNQGQGRWDKNRSHGNGNRNQPGNQKASNAEKSPNAECGLCGGPYPHEGGRERCPAFKSTCHNCGVIGHFAKKCRKKDFQASQQGQSSHRGRGRPVHSIDEAAGTSQQAEAVNSLTWRQELSDEEDQYVFSVTTPVGTRRPLFMVKINDIPVKMLGDTGAPVNIISENTFRQISPSLPLHKADTTLYPYGPNAKALPLIGMFNANLSSDYAKQTAKVYVTDGHDHALLSRSSSEALQLITIRHEAVVADLKPESKVDQLLEKYKDCFSGLGKLKDFQVKIHIDKSVQPSQQTHRRIPYHLRDKVEAEIKRLEELDIIEHVEGDTPWVSPIVAADKINDPGAIRLCVDMREANQAILRERHLTPTIDDLIHDLNGASVFSKLDLNQGYHQLELAPESRYITTFTTHLGLRRYKRLNFGISSAAEVFQNKIQTTLEGIPGVRNMSDDIIVYAKDQATHDQNLGSLLERITERGLTLNRKKCEFSKSSLEFFGYRFSEKGMEVDPKKVDSISKIAPPENPGELLSLLGMTNYCSKFIPDYATLTEPLRRLTRKNAEWIWTTEHSSALEKLKSHLMTPPVLAYFDPSKETTIFVDASPVGLGAILAQRHQEGYKTITFASKALSPVEQRYSQLEREALAVVWGCEHFHLYVFGAPVEVVTDHKPLLGIYGKPKSKPSARVERWALRLIPYDMTLTYQSGKTNPADYMSRHPEETTSSRSTHVAEEYVHFLAREARPVAIPMDELVAKSRDDVTLTQVRLAISTNNWDDINMDPLLKSYHNIRDELSVVDDAIILRGTRICIPEALQKRTIELAHQGHQGITKTKALLREKVWFPNIDHQVETKIKDCFACQAKNTRTTREPLEMTKLSRPGEQMSMDFADIGNNQHLMVVIDDFTRYPEVEVLTSLTAAAVIPRLDCITARWGTPETLKSDNGPPFQSKEFADYAKEEGFKHHRVTPLWPEANGEVERFMRTIKDSVHTARIEGKDWKREMWGFLRNYRATPHSSTKVPPAKAMIGRNIRTKITQLPEVPNSHVNDTTRANDAKAKDKMKNYADNRRHTKDSNLEIGNSVIVKRKGFKTSFDPRPYVVTEINGSQIKARRGNEIITRNSSFFKKVTVPLNIPRHDDEYEYDHEQVPERRADQEPNVVQPPGMAEAEIAQAPPERRPARDRRRPRFLEDYVLN